MDSISFQSEVMKVASIDIGTNTLLLLIAEVTESGLEIIEDYHLIARLGENVDKTGEISTEAIERGCAILRNYKQIIDKAEIENVVIVGTSALRDAKNRDLVCAKFEEIIGSPVRIIRGEEEANHSFLGSKIDESNNIVMDIGGGSTEFVSGSSSKINFRRSLDIGAVRLTERFLKGAGSQAEQIEELNKFLSDELAKLNKDELKGEIVAVAGTPTSLAQMNLGLKNYDYTLIHKYRFSLVDLKKNIEILINTPKEDLISKYHIHPNRADILLAGSLILQKFVEYMQREDFIVSCHGLRFGVVLDYFQSLKRLH